MEGIALSMPGALYFAALILLAEAAIPDAMALGIRQAFILGAGLGVRLQPLTSVLPKPLIPIFGKPLITFALDQLCALGIDSFVINAHHLAGKLESMFATGAYAGRPLRVVFEPDLLETGGGIKNVEDILGDEPFLVYSGDVLTDIDLARLAQEHFQRGNDVTLALRKTGLTTHIAFQEDRVVDIKNQIGTGITGNYDFANVSVWNPEIFGRIPIGKKVSFVPVLVDWIRAGGRIGGVVLERGQWFNISSRKEYLDVHREIVHQGWRPEYVGEPLWPLQVSNEATVAPSARLIGVNYLSPGCVIESDATLEDCILWSRSRITAGTKLKRCVVARATPISGEYTDFDFV